MGSCEEIVCLSCVKTDADGGRDCRCDILMMLTTGVLLSKFLSSEKDQEITHNPGDTSIARRNRFLLPV